ncbi:MAG: DUF2225 domain-containing protein [Syntrophomonadaceae bacterium]
MQRVNKVKLQFSNPRKIDEVFASYYLMLQYLQMSTQDPSAGAKVWLRLSWLYYDVQDEEMYIYASQQAYDMFKDAYYNSRRSTTVEQEQRLSLLLGELSLRLGNRDFCIIPKAENIGVLVAQKKDFTPHFVELISD